MVCNLWPGHSCIRGHHEEMTVNREGGTQERAPGRKGVVKSDGWEFFYFFHGQETPDRQQVWRGSCRQVLRVSISSRY